MTRDEVVNGVARNIVWWIGERRAKFENLNHDSMAINPFLAPLVMGLNDLKNFDELAGALLAAHLYQGHATGFGKLIDEKILPNVFGTRKLDAAFRKTAPYNESKFDEIDHIVTRPDGGICLLSQKASRWTIQLTMAVQLNKAFVDIIKARQRGQLKFSKIVVGVFYGTNDTLTDKYDILRGINRGAVHDVTDLCADVVVVAGRQFWSWLNGDQEATQDWVMDGILKGYQEAVARYGSTTALVTDFKRSFVAGFAEYNTQDSVDWHGILRKING